jgi:hypothetical protein
LRGGTFRGTSGDSSFRHPGRFVEAPALSPDGRSLYFHRLVGDKFAVFRAPKR